MILILIAGIIPTLIVTCYMQMGMMNTLKKREMENMQESLKQAVDAIDDQAQIYENLIDYLSYSGDLRKVLKMERASDFNTYLKYTQVADPLLNMPQVYHKEIKGITLYADNIQVAHGSTLAPLSEIQGENWYPRNNRSLIRWIIINCSNRLKKSWNLILPELSGMKTAMSCIPAIKFPLNMRPGRWIQFRKYRKVFPV